jgi:hypothetical protein
MVESEIMDFFDPLVDDEISKALIRMLGKTRTEENFDAILEKLIVLFDGEKNQ